MPESKPVQIANTIRKDIFEKTYYPGEMLPSIRVLVTATGYSKNTIQEAYKILEDEGLVEIVPGARPRVCAPLSEKDRMKRLSLHLKEMLSTLKKFGYSKDEIETSLKGLMK